MWWRSFKSQSFCFIFSFTVLYLRLQGLSRLVLDKVWAYFSTLISRQVTRVYFHWRLVFTTNFSYKMTRQQAPEIVSASLQQNTSQALYFWKSFIRTNSWRRRLLCKKHYSTFSQSIFTLRCKNTAIALMCYLPKCLRRCVLSNLNPVRKRSTVNKHSCAGACQQ